MFVFPYVLLSLLLTSVLMRLISAGELAPYSFAMLSNALSLHARTYMRSYIYVYTYTHIHTHNME